MCVVDYGCFKIDAIITIEHVSEMVVVFPNLTSGLKFEP